jgi:diguanylate cyclase (GGDEF)-like protein
MATHLILVIGAILLACGSGGLFIVHENNPRLKGLGWLGGSFASGCIGAAMLSHEQHLSVWLGTIGADILILGAFVLLHVAFLDLLSEDEIPLPRLGIFLIVLQVAVDLSLILFDPSDNLRIVWAGGLIAVQTIQTTTVLIVKCQPSVRAPVWFSITLLTVFSVFNLLRSLATALGVLDRVDLSTEIAAATYIFYIVVALGMAFGFFWLTATILTAKLEQMASTDPLTRVYNRRVFLDWCEKELHRSQRTGTPFSILMVDLDHFKDVNDTFGHQGGDLALCAAVEEIQDSIRGIDVLGRWGGEEFTVLLPGASLEAAFVVAERVRRNIAGISLPMRTVTKRDETRFVTVTASVGLAAFQGEEDTIADVMQRADSALYQAKARGRNQVSFQVRS